MPLRSTAGVEALIVPTPVRSGGYPAVRSEVIGLLLDREELVVQLARRHIVVGLLQGRGLVGRRLADLCTRFLVLADVERTDVALLVRAGDDLLDDRVEIIARVEADGDLVGDVGTSTRVRLARAH